MSYEATRNVRLQDILESDETSLEAFIENNRELLVDINDAYDRNFPGIVALNDKIDANSKATLALVGTGNEINSLIEKINSREDEIDALLAEIESEISLDTLSYISTIITSPVDVPSIRYIHPQVEVDSSGRITSIKEQLANFYRRLHITTVPKTVLGAPLNKPFDANLYSKESVSIYGNQVSVYGTAFFSYDIFDFDISSATDFFDILSQMNLNLQADVDLQIKIPLPIPYGGPERKIPSQISNDLQYSGFGQDEAVEKTFTSIGWARVNSEPFNFEDIVDYILDQIFGVFGDFDFAKVINGLIKVVKSARTFIDRIKIDSSFLNNLLNNFAIPTLPNISVDGFADVSKAIETFTAFLNGMLSSASEVTDFVLSLAEAIDFLGAIEEVLDAIGLESILFPTLDLVRATGLPNPDGSDNPYFPIPQVDLDLVEELFEDLRSFINDYFDFFKSLSNVLKDILPFSIPSDIDNYDLENLDFREFFKDILQTVIGSGTTRTEITEYVLLGNNGQLNDQVWIDLKDYVFEALEAVAIAIVNPTAITSIPIPIFSLNYEYQYIAKREDIENYIQQDIVEETL